jgi:DHA2 family multidrug resistance protein
MVSASAMRVVGPAAPARAAAAADPYANRYIIAITVTLAAVMELIDTSIVNVAIPHMMGNLGATLDQITWVSTGYIIANVVILPITGWLSALFGRRRYLAGSIALFTVASFFCGNSHSLVELVSFRILQGLGGGALLSTAQAVLYEVFPPEEYGIAMAIFGMGIMVGPTLGPTLGGYITDTWSWPWIFFINIPFGIVAFLLSVTYIGDSRHAQKVGRIDYVGLLLLALGIGTLQTLLERGERLDWFASRQIVTLAIVSGVSLVALVWHELRTDHPVIDLSVLKSRQLAAGLAFGGVLGVCLYATVFVLPVYLQVLQHYTANQTGLVILPGALASAFVMAFIGRFRGRYDPRLAILLGVSIFMVAMWQHAHFTTLSGGDDFLLPLILRGFGLGMIFVPLTNLSLADLPMAKIPAGTGLFNLFRQLGGSLGIAISATLLGHFEAQTHARLAESVTRFNPVASARLAAITSAMVAQGAPRVVAESRAIALLDGQVWRQAMMLSFERLFLMFGMGFALSLPLLLLMRHGKGIPGAKPAYESDH